MSALLELAARCEAAEGPDEAIDLAIVYALHPDIGPYQGQCIGDEPIFWHDPYRKQPCPRFTASLDAAMTLVPEGHDWLREAWDTMTVYPERDRESIDYSRDATGQAATPALALCAAALRARAA